MCSLAEPAKQTLLDVARRAVVRAVASRELLDELPEDEALQQPGGAFVTLHRSGRLRGCVGQLASKDPLVSVVAYCAMAAALDDPRFTPMTMPELRDVLIEISVLSALIDISPSEIETGKHGLLVSQAGRRGVLLPQVATEFGWTASRFLEETCVKAGLGRDAFQQPGTLVQAFTAEVFSEPGFHAERVEARVKPGYSTST